jgi:hypothetical protein
MTKTNSNEIRFNIAGAKQPLMVVMLSECSVDFKFERKEVIL